MQIIPWNKNKSVGQKIKLRRKQLNLSQEELAIKIGGKSKQHIHELENACKRPSADMLFKVAAALEAPMLYFLDENCRELNEVDEEVLLTEYRKVSNKKLAIELVKLIGRI